jgi:hypothetical protein
MASQFLNRFEAIRIQSIPSCRCGTEPLRIEAWAAESVRVSVFAWWTPRRYKGNVEDRKKFKATCIIIVYLLSVYTMSLKKKLAN